MHMTDTMSSAQRHHCMASIHSSATKPEMLVRHWLWSHGYRYRLNVKGVPGKPDIVMRRYHTAIFINGCFWHGHEGCNNYRKPKSNIEFWENKITRNQQRDQKNYRLLRDNGWQVIVIWECQLTTNQIERTMCEMELLLNNKLLSLYQKHKTINYQQSEPKDSLPIAAENGPEYGSQKRN